MGAVGRDDAEYIKFRSLSGPSTNESKLEALSAAERKGAEASSKIRQGLASQPSKSHKSSFKLPKSMQLPFAQGMHAMLNKSTISKKNYKLLLLNVLFSGIDLSPNVSLEEKEELREIVSRCKNELSE
ncbi:MAG: hypothetical protein H0T62_02635 [Parachlamydiaceae bacterium]|nr:hypothetical protein [Parachlamydiaceae bacterium]